MSDPARQSGPEGWPSNARQFDVWPFDAATLDVWEEHARAGAWRLPLGHFNWPMVIRSLCAEVRRLRKEHVPRAVCPKCGTTKFSACTREGCPGI